MDDFAGTAGLLALRPLLVAALLVRGGSLLAQAPGPIPATIPAMGVNVRDYGASGSEAQTTGRIVGEEKVVEVADAASFKPGQGIYLWLDLPEDGLVLADAGGPDFTLECDVSFGAGRPGYADHHGGVVFRARDSGNFWIVYFQGFPACAYQLGLKKMVEGRLQDAGPLIGHPELPASFHLKVVTAGPAISVFVNEKQLGQTIEDPFCADQGQVGFFRHAGFSAPTPTTNPWYAGGGAIRYSRFSAGKLKDDFDRPNSWKSLGPPWKPVLGTWGIYEKSAFAFLANKGTGLSTEVVGIDGKSLRLKDPFPAEKGKSVEVSVYHDDTAAIDRACAALKQDRWVRTGNLLFPEGTYCLSRPLYGNWFLGLLGVPNDGYTFSRIKALPGFAPSPDVERFVIWFRDVNMGDKWAQNPRGDWPYESWNNNNFGQRIERLMVEVIRPDTSPGVSGLGLGSSVNSYYSNLGINNWRKRGVLFPQGTDNVYGVNLASFGNVESPVPGPCFELCGTYSNTIILDNLEVTAADIGVLAHNEVWGCTINGVNAEMTARPVVLEGCKAVTVKGINAGLEAMTDHAVVEVRGCQGAVEVDGTNAGYRRSVEVDGYTFGTGTQPGAFTPFHYTGGQDALWFRTHHGRSVQASAASNQATITDQPTVVDEFRVGRPRSGSVYYQYAAAAGADLEAAGETGLLAVLYVGNSVSVRKLQLLSTGGAARELIVPSVEMTAEGVVRVMIRSADREPVSFLASRTEMTFCKPLPLRLTPPRADVDLPLVEGGYLPAFLAAGPMSFTGALTEQEKLNVGSSVMAREWVSREADLRPEPGAKVRLGGAEFAWLPVGTQDKPSLDLNRVLAGGEVAGDSVAYLVTYVIAPRRMENLTLSLGVDDYVKVFVNGREVYVWDKGGGLVPDQYQAKGISLAEGANVLVFKAANGAMGWGVSARFLAPDAKAVQDLVVRLKP